MRSVGHLSRFAAGNGGPPPSPSLEGVKGGGRGLDGDSGGAGTHDENRTSGKLLKAARGPRFGFNSM